MSHVFFDRFYALCRAHGTYPNVVGAQLGASSGSITAWKQGATPRSAMLQKIAGHFGVTTDYLLGKEPATPLPREELKFALFGGDAPISDEMLQEVLDFAQFVKHRNK